MYQRLITLFCFLFCAICPNAWANEKPDQAMFLNTLPQAGPYYFSSTVCKFYSLSTFKVAHKTFPQDSIFEQTFLRLVDGKDRYFAEAYVPPTEHNMSLFTNHLPKMILHVRDPRDALVSWIEYVDRHKHHKFTLGRFPPVPPEEYFSWNYEQKVDWQIQNFFSYCLAWLEDWADFLEHNDCFSVKITSFEEMVSDPLAFFKDVAAFYGTDPELFTESNVFTINPYQYHFSATDIAIWKDRLTPEQQAVVTSMISDRLSQTFGWDK